MIRYQVQIGQVAGVPKTGILHVIVVVGRCGGAGIRHGSLLRAVAVGALAGDCEKKRPNPHGFLP